MFSDPSIHFTGKGVINVLILGLPLQAFGFSIHLYLLLNVSEFSIAIHVFHNSFVRESNTFSTSGVNQLVDKISGVTLS